MDFRKWQEEQNKSDRENDSSLPPKEKFFGRGSELLELEEFMRNSTQKIFCLYGVPMIGKSTLVREFCKTATNYRIVTIKFFNPENPEITLEKAISNFNGYGDDPKLIIVENFEETLLWKGDQEHLHEIKLGKIRSFLQEIFFDKNTKLILESRFMIKNDFLPQNVLSELSTKQLGKIERQELFNSLNETYRHNRVQFDTFEEVCEKLNDHVWLVELAMQNNWLFEDVREVVKHPESLTQKLWQKIETIIRKLPIQHRILLCAFGIINPILETDIKSNFESIPLFSKKDELNNALWSLRKKLLLTYESKSQFYELNPFLREVCFTYLQLQKEMRIIDQLPFFKNVQRPKYNNILQAHEKGDYTIFFKLIKEKRKRTEFEEVLDILKEVYWTNPKKEVILNEIAVTYKWKKDYPKAISILKELINDYKHIPAFTELAIIYKESKQYNEAINILNEALNINNQDVKTKNELAIVNKESGNFEKAIELFKELIEKHKHIPAYTELSIIYRDKKNHNEAIHILKQALTINENDLTTLNQLAINLLEIKDFDNALLYVEKGLKTDPWNYFLKNSLTNIMKEKSKIKNEIIKVNASSVKQKILFISANPSNESRIQTDTEYRIIKAEIKRGSHRDFFEFLQPQFAVTITELIRSMNERPDIIHFSGHGNTDGIAITTDNNSSQVLPLNAIERLFKPLQGHAKLIILNSCYSSNQAKLISKFGMYVVGNNLSINDGTAISFSKGLYNGLSEGKKFNDAFNDALIVVVTEDVGYTDIIEVWKDGEKVII